MTTVEKLLLICVLAQVALTFGLLLWLGSMRVPLVLRRQIRIADIALSREAWPDRARQAANAFDNQFQLPVLFHVGVLLTLWAHVGNWALAVLAVLFVLARFVHALIHVGTNHVQSRFLAYTVSFIVLVFYWIVLAVAILTTPAVS